MCLILKISWKNIAKWIDGAQCAYEIMRLKCSYSIRLISVVQKRKSVFSNTNG